MKLGLLTVFLIFSISGFAQDWWTKTKEQSIPKDLTTTTLLVEKFKTQKLNDAPPQAFIDKEDQSEHPLIKKTNENIEVYNEEMKAIFKNYKFNYVLASKKRCEDSLKYSYADAKYILKHEVYLRRFQKNGVNDYFYTYVFYFYERETKKSYPYVYLFEEKRLLSLEKLVGYLNSL
jgi:hypothetical protein